MHAALITISSILALISPIVYAGAILRGEAKPHRTTRLVLLIITTLATASLFAQHDRVAIWLAGVSTIQSIIIFTLSIKHGMGGWSREDLVCLAAVQSWTVQHYSYPLYLMLINLVMTCVILLPRNGRSTTSKSI